MNQAPRGMTPNGNGQRGHIYKYILLILKFILLFLIIADKFNLLPDDAPIFVLLENIFQYMLGFYILWGFLPTKPIQLELDGHDQFLIFFAGILLIHNTSWTELTNAWTEVKQRIAQL